MPALSTTSLLTVLVAVLCTLDFVLNVRPLRLSQTSTPNLNFRTHDDSVDSTLRNSIDQILTSKTPINLWKRGMAVSRSVTKKVLAIEQAEGDGARVRRSIGTMKLRNLSPFLM